MFTPGRWGRSYGRTRRKQKPDFDRMIPVLYAARQLRSTGTTVKNAIGFSVSNSVCSLRRACKFGYELRASAAPRLRPAAPSRAQIQHSTFKIIARDEACGGHADSDTSCGPSPGETATRRCLTASNLLWGTPAAERWACFRAVRGCSPPPGGGCGALRAQIQNSELRSNMQNRGLAQ